MQRRTVQEWGEVYNRIIEAIKAGEIEPSLTAASKLVGIAYRPLHNGIKNYNPDFSVKDLRAAYAEAFGEEIAKSEDRQPDHYSSSIQINEDGSQISDRLVAMMEEERKDPRRLLELHNYDPDQWVIVSAIDNLWHMPKSYMIGGGLAMLYQSKITVKPKTGMEFTLEDVEKFFATFTMRGQPKRYQPKQYQADGDVLEINLSDMHKGNRSPYDDLDIDAVCRETVKDILDRCKGRKFSKIYLTPLGDIFHFDTKRRTTTSGTIMETDRSTFQEIFETGLRLFIWIIDNLAVIAPVEYIHISGNHDYVLSYTFAKALECWYQGNQNVIIDTGHKPRKWRVIYSSLVAWMHGEMGKSNALSWLMAEARQEWGQVSYAEIHAGHYHSQQTIEKNGLILRYLPSMTGTDEWHYQKGYVGAVKATMSFVWGENGLKEIWQTNT